MTRSRRVRRAAAATCVSLLLGTGLAACGSEEPEATAQTPSVSAATTPATPDVADPTSSPGEPTAKPATVPKALDFSGTTVSGAAFAGSSLVGKPTVLWFWAPWCAVCRSQAPGVEKLASAYGDRVNIIGVGSLDSGNAIEGFADDVSGPTHLSDPDGAIWKRFRIAEQSSFVVLDNEGREVLRTGYDDEDAVAGTVKKLAG